MKDNIKMYQKRLGCENVNCVQVTRDRVQCGTCVNTIVIFRVLENLSVGLLSGELFLVKQGVYNEAPYFVLLSGSKE
jgi:hypothetical protein